MIDTATSRIWIYQANRFLTEEEAAQFNEFFSEFVANWKAHGKKLDAQYELKDRLFLIINVDEGAQEATGCSVDASVHAIKEIQSQLGIDFFNRQRVAYQKDGELQQCSMAEFKTLAKNGEVGPETLVFNNTISQVVDFDTHWKVPASLSWHKMLLN